MSLATAKALAVFAPRVDYPYAARAKGITGSGVYILNVNVKTGQVASVTIQRSSGRPVLDRAAMGTLKRWRFRPGTVSKVALPVTWTLP